MSDSERPPRKCKSLVSYKQTRSRVSSKHSVSSTSETLGASESTQVSNILVSENSSPIGRK